MEQSPMLVNWLDKVKVVILPKAISIFSVIAIKIPTQFFIELERAISNFIWNKKKQDSKNQFEQ